MNRNSLTSTTSVAQICQRARGASYALAAKNAQERSEALAAIAKAIRSHSTEIIAANARDMQAAKENALSAAMTDRLLLDEKRVTAMADAVDEIAAMDDLLGQVVSQSERPNGLQVSRVRIPLGVVAMIYESRPNVTSDAAALCLRSGNAAVLRGGKEAFHSNHAIAKAIGEGLRNANFPEESVQVFPTTDRQALSELLQQEDTVDLVIPRGGEGLIRFVSEHSKIPVIKHYKGVCHLYVHSAANLEMAQKIAENGKSRPGVCNALETILVDRSVAKSFLPSLALRFAEEKIEMRGDAESLKIVAEDPSSAEISLKPATEEDWHAEYLAKIVAIRVVEDMSQALEHIQQYASNHTEAIISDDPIACERFKTVCNSSTVVVNASTRFADGGQLGLGAEIGISTTKLHAYGPMGAEGLTTTKFVVEGTGQVRP